MNETECDNLLESVKWTEPGRLVSLAILEFINVLVIVGNCLVIAAVFCSNKLRSVTNYFIVNLAVADLLVGLAVLPFSATWEVYKVWIFGDVWCRIWLAVDVWMCTASILNLCAISLDRYVAVTRPVSYPSIMSTKRAKSLIAGIWILSFVICFPPLVGWKDQKPETTDMYYNRGNVTLYIATLEPPASSVVVVTPKPCPWKCELTNDRGYVLYSALGSFYIPMFVMLFFYWRIYRAAVRTTRAINQGFKTTKGCKGKSGEHFDETTFTLRMHRGRSSKGEKTNSKSDSFTNEPATSLSGSRKSTGRTAPKTGVLCKLKRQNSENSIISTAFPFAPSQPIIDTNVSSTLVLKDETVTSFVAAANAQTALLTTSSPAKLKKESSKRNSKFQVRRFRMETKAAKTLAIIVGGFIICWLPFFSMYLVRAFCPDCIQPLLFSILFWLGYCNSAINPVIYALFSNEFRIAFKRILFRGVCTRSAFRAAENFQMVAARACLAPINFHQTISDYNPHETEDVGWQLLPPSPFKKNPKEDNRYANDKNNKNVKSANL